MQERLARVKRKEKAARRRKCEAEAAELIATFMHDPSDDEDSRQFWCELCGDDKAGDIFKHTATTRGLFESRARKQQPRALRLTLESRVPNSS